MTPEKKSSRKPISPALYNELLEKNAGVCCVCKKQGYGVNLHHIDEDPSNNLPDNLALLCVQEHDRYHRPDRYPAFNHEELTAAEIREAKQDWETFLSKLRDESRGPFFVNVCPYGDVDHIHSMTIGVQDDDGDLRYIRNFTGFDGPPEHWIDAIFETLDWMAPDNHRVLIAPHEPEDIEYCPCSEHGHYSVLTRTVDRPYLLRHRKDWSDQSSMAIFYNDAAGSAACVLSYATETIFSMSLHLCRGTDLHVEYSKEGVEASYRVKPKNVRKKASDLIGNFVREWEPAVLLGGIGDPDEPEPLADMTHPPERWLAALESLVRGSRRS